MNKKKSTKNSHTKLSVKSVKPIAKADSVVMTKTQYESLSVQEKSKWVPFYYATRDSVNGSVPMYSLPGVYDSELLYIKSAPSSSKVSKTKALTTKKKTPDKTKVVLPREKPSDLEKKAQILPTIEIKKDTLEVEVQKSKSAGSRKDSTETQYTQPIDMAVNADSSDLAHDYVSADSSSVKRDSSSVKTTEPFMVANNDSLYLLGPYGNLTKDQKVEWNKKVIEYTEKGFRRVALGTLIRASRIERAVEKASGTRFGLEYALGTNREELAGAFLEIPLTSWLAVEGFGNYYFAKGNPLSSGTQTEVTTRQR